MRSRYRKILSASNDWYSFIYSILVNSTDIDGAIIKEWISAKDNEYLESVYSYIKHNKSIDTIDKAADCIISLSSGKMGISNTETELDRILNSEDRTCEYALVGEDLNFRFSLFSNRIISAIRSNTGGLFVITGPEKSGKSRIFSSIYEKIVKENGLVSVEWNSIMSIPIKDRKCQDFDVLFIDDADDELRVNSNDSFILDIKRRRNKPIIIASCKNISRISDLISYIEPKIFIIPEYNRNEIADILHNMQFGAYQINYGSCRELVVRLSNMKIDNILKEAMEIINYICSVSGNMLYKKADRWVIPYDIIISSIFACTGKIITIDYDEAYNEISNKLRNRIKGQEDVINQIMPSLVNIRTGIMDITKPSAVILAVGPSGTGKTELGKAIADILYDGKVHKEDMNIYYDKHMISKIIGSPPGYTGSGDITTIMNFVKSNKEGVIIFDEIEKCHSSVKDAIMEMLDTGFMSDSIGRVYDFRGFFILMTSNAGFDKEDENKSFNIGFNNPVTNEEIRKNDSEVIDNLTKNDIFSKSFMSRVHPVIFKNLVKEDIVDIAAIMINDLFSRFTDIGINIDEKIADKYPAILDSVIDSFSTTSGARSMKRYVENDLKKEVLSLIDKREYKNKKNEKEKNNCL